MKKLLALLLVCALCAGLCACGKKEEKTDEGFKPSLDTKTEASFTIIGDFDNYELFQAVISSFKKIYPNVTITCEKVSNYKENADKRLESDPTVGIYMSGTNTQGEELLQHGYSISAFGPVINSALKDGKLYSVPIGVDVRGLVVNADLLKKEGLKVPENLAEFTAVCDALVAKGYTPIQQENASLVRGVMQGYVWATIANSENPQKLLETINSGEKGSMECFRPAMQLMRSFYDKGYINVEVNNKITSNYEPAILNFFEGNVAFLPVNCDTVSGMKKRESKSEAFQQNPFEYYMIYSPVGEKGFMADISCWRTLSVNPNAQNKALAIEFLKFLGTQDMLNLLAEVKGIPSAAKTTQDARFANLLNGKGQYVYVWEYKDQHDAWNSAVARTGEYARGALGDVSVDEALEILVNDIVEKINP